MCTCRSQWSRGFAAARLLGLRVRIPPENGCLSLSGIVCVVGLKSLRRADHSSRGLLQNVVCLSVMRRNSKPLHLEWGRQKLRKRKKGRKKERKKDMYVHAKNVLNFYKFLSSLWKLLMNGNFEFKGALSASGVETTVSREQVAWQALDTIRTMCPPEELYVFHWVTYQWLCWESSSGCYSHVRWLV